MSNREELLKMAEHCDLHANMSEAVTGLTETLWRNEARTLRAKAAAMGEKQKVLDEVEMPSWNINIKHFIYVGKMPIATVLATIAAWVKWLLKENGMIMDLGMSNCPLCARFRANGDRCVREGEKCPLYVKNNRCSDTPWCRTATHVPDADREMRRHIEAKIPVEFKPLLDGIQYAIRNAKVEPKPAQEKVTFEQVKEWAHRMHIIGANPKELQRNDVDLEIRRAFGKEE